MDRVEIDLLKSAMLSYAWRTRVLETSPANVDSRGNQRLSISFEDEMYLALQSRGTRDVAPGESGSKMDPPPLLPGRSDGSAIDADSGADIPY